MAATRYVVMGPGEVGYHLARSLSQQKRDVSVIETDPQKRGRIEDELDGLAVEGNGSHPSVLKAADAVGPTESFAIFNAAEKALMVVLMWVGRLEVYSIAALFTRAYWRP